MEKPISIILNELKQNIADDINKAQLPFCIIEPIIKDIYNEISILTQQQLKQDIQEYENDQKEKEE